MPVREHKYILWLDLETTGSDLIVKGSKDARHEIIEVGAAITDLGLNVLSSRSYVLGFDIAYENLKPVVLEMHTKNGLWKDVAKMNKVSSLRISDVDREMSDWIREFNGSNHMAFAGSGVSHFDRKFIIRDMPLLDNRITHWALDVGALRRTFKMLVGSDEWPEDNKSHRALDDVFFHIEEMRYAVDIIRKGLYNVG